MFRHFRFRLYSALAGVLCVVADRAAWSNTLTLAGAASIAAGAYWVYPPAGLITAGLAGIALAVLMHGNDDRRLED